MPTQPSRPTDVSESVAPIASPTSELQDRVLRVAARQFAQRGFHAVSIRDIARECKVSVSTVLYGRRTKQQLLEAILARSFAAGSPWAAILTELDPTQCTDRQSFLDAYDIFINVLVQHAVDTPDTRRLWLRLLLDQPELFESFEAKYTRPLVKHGFLLLSTARDLGIISGDDTRLRHFLGSIDWVINGFYAGGIFDFEGRRIGVSEPSAVRELVAYLHEYVRIWFPETQG